LTGDERSPRPGPLRRGAEGGALAIAFLTVLPVRAGDWGPDGLRRAGAWFPLVGALVGAVAGGVRLLCQPLLGPAPASVLAIIVLVALTGGLHQDALADAADGLGAHGDRQRRLAAMRDSAVGVFGALAIALWALLLVSVLASLSQEHAFRALIAGAAVGRWAAQLHTAATRPARTEGLGASFHTDGTSLAAGTLLAALTALLACKPLPGLGALGAGAAVAGGSALLARRAFGGRTGDTIGATVAVAEATVCTVLLAIWQPS
jgi:adenosylcobinamide-GDP ribazoletransferase